MGRTGGRLHQAFRGTKPSVAPSLPKLGPQNSVPRREPQEHPGTQWHQAFRTSIFMGSTGSTSGPGGTKPSETRSSDLGSTGSTS
jgi:hypothetical protein